MRLSQYIDHQPERRKASRRKGDRHKSVITHGVFVPMITIWGAALFGLGLAVFPASAIERMAMITGLGVSDMVARFIFSGLAAVVGAALAFVIAGALQARAIARSDDDALVTAVHSRRTMPIDPATDLGSASLDAPLEPSPLADAKEEVGEFDALILADEHEEASVEPADERPPLLAQKPKRAQEREATLGELSQRGYEFEAPEDVVPAKEQSKSSGIAFTHKQFQSALIESCEGATCEAEAETAFEPAADKPAQLDLAEFAQLPGRNAVWVEEVPQDVSPSEAIEREDAKTADAKPALLHRAISNASAIEKLRQKPPEDLSIVEMVERFAAALHERQRADRARAPAGVGTRDAALADALKALTIFTSQLPESEEKLAERAKVADDPRVATTERELRDALAKLQDLRGAA